MFRGISERGEGPDIFEIKYIIELNKYRSQFIVFKKSAQGMPKSLRKKLKETSKLF